MTKLHTVPSRESVLATLLAAFVKVTGREPASVSLAESSRLHFDLGLDSYSAIELIFELEDLAGVRITPEAAASFRTVGDVVSCVLGELLAAPAPVAGAREDASAP
jgi:acyl carrier protein